MPTARHGTPRNRVRARTAVLAFALGAVVTLSPATNAHADSVRNPDPAVQAQIDEQLAAVVGGVQVSPNEVSYLNGDIVMVFAEADGFVPTGPGTRVVADKAGSTYYKYGCPYGNRVQWYCFYEHISFGGRMLQFKDCSSSQYGLYQRFTDWNFNDRTSSWVNTSIRLIDVYDNLGPSGYLWHEGSNSAIHNVGVGNNDRASSFVTRCGGNFGDISQLPPI